MAPHTAAATEAAQRGVSTAEALGRSTCLDYTSNARRVTMT